MADAESGVALPLPPAPGFLYPPTQPPPSSPQEPASGSADTAPHLGAGAGLGGVSGKVQIWAVPSSRCSGIWPGSGSGERAPLKCPGGAPGWRSRLSV